MPRPGTAPNGSNGWLDYLIIDIGNFAPAGTAGGPQAAPQMKLSRRYCGSDEPSCRALLNTALAQALKATSAQYGADSRRWRVPTIYDDCVQIDFPPTGDAKPVAPIPWQNRGTYVEVITGR